MKFPPWCGKEFLMPAFTLSTIAQATGHPFVALPGKSGNVSNAAERQADALNPLSRAALLGVALVGKGAKQKRMVEVFSSLPHRKAASVVTGAQAS
jgi:hypothetical protein